MNKRNLLPILSLFMFCSAYAHLYEDFDTLSWPDNTFWIGDRDQYKINKGGLLQSNADGAGFFRLYRALELDLSEQNTTWEFYVKLSFNTSDANYSIFYLMLDKPLSEHAFCGYFLQIGNKRDCISLYRQDETNTVLLSEGESGRLNKTVNAMRIKVRRTADGEWQLWVKEKHEMEFQQDGRPTVDRTYRKGSYIGLSSVCTASRKSSFYYDEISVKQTGEQDDEDDWREDEKDPDNTNSDLDEELSGYRDYGAVVFSELMVNPKGNTHLPEVEYLELYNTTDHPIDLAGWGFYYGEKGYSCTSYRLESHAYVLLMHPSKRDLFPPEMPILPITSFPALRNTGNFLCLLDANGQVIHWLEYTDKWYRDTQKKKGGFSLECIDPTNYGDQEQNWRASEDATGGTPGRVNSINAHFPDTVVPRLSEVSHYAMGTLELTFTKPMTPELLSRLEGYVCRSSVLKVIDAYPLFPRYQTVRLKMNRFFEAKTDTLVLQDLVDRSGLKLPETTLFVTQDTVWFQEKVPSYSDSSGENNEKDPVFEEKMLWLERDYLTPTLLAEDGTLKIYYAFPQEGWMITYSIYTLSGYRVDKRESGVLNMPSGTLEWDGRTAAGSVLMPGIYVLYAECIQPSTGRIKHYKMPIVINRYD